MVCVVDTKWKPLKPDLPNDGVSPADIYQMHAYASRYDAPEVVLLYSHHAALGEHRTWRNRYQLSAKDGGPGHHSIAAGTVDLTDLASILRQLERIVGPEAPP